MLTVKQIVLGSCALLAINAYAVKYHPTSFESNFGMSIVMAEDATGYGVIPHELLDKELSPFATFVLDISETDTKIQNFELKMDDEKSKAFRALGFSEAKIKTSFISTAVDYVRSISGEKKIFFCPTAAFCYNLLLVRYGFFKDDDDYMLKGTEIYDVL